MRKFKIQIKGVTPYMQHRMDTAKLQEWEQKRGKIIENKGLNTDDEIKALFHSYIDNEGNHYIPNEHFKQAFIKGGAFVKAKVGNSSRSMKNIVAGMWMVSPEHIPFRKFDEIDVRPANNIAAHAKIIVTRPKWQSWECSFILNVDDDGLLSQPMIESIIDYAGRYLGVGSYRPEHTGEYGRFKIKSIEEVGEEKEKIEA